MDKLQGVSEQRWNPELEMVFPTMILRRDGGVRRARDISRHIMRWVKL